MEGGGFVYHWAAKGHGPVEPGGRGIRQPNGIRQANDPSPTNATHAMTLRADIPARRVWPADKQDQSTKRNPSRRIESANKPNQDQKTS